MKVPRDMVFNEFLIRLLHTLKANYRISFVELFPVSFVV